MTAAILLGMTIAPFSSPPLKAEEQNATLFVYDMGEGYLSGMSDNGLWGLYKMPDYSEVDAYPRRMNLRTGQVEQLPLISSQNPPHICQQFDITDDGTMIYGSFDDLPAYYSLADEQWHDMKLSFRWRGYTGAVRSVTPDGSWACGWMMSSIASFRPVLWHNNEPEELGNLPTYDELFAKGIIDREDYDEHIRKEQTPNIAFWKVSADGRHVLASTDHNYPNWGCAYFIYHTDTKTYDWIEDPDQPLHTYTSGASMSDNGEWVSASWSGTKVNADGTWDEYHHAFRFHVPDSTVDHHPVSGVIGDEGEGRSLSVTVDGTRISYETIMRQVYGLDIREITGYDSFGRLFFVSTDGKTILCQPSYRTTAFSASVPVSFQEAALKVNLLAESHISPDPGAVLSRLEQVTIAFDTPADVSSTMKGAVMRGNEMVAESASIIPSADRRSFTISFPGLLLEEGISYELFLPEGLFMTRDGRQLSPSASVTYTGRADLPLAPVRITPADGSGVQEISAYSMIILDFDTRPFLAGEKEALLYEGDSDKPMARLSIVAENNRVGLYPAASRRLAKGKEYRVLIPQGTFTDIVGNCPNEEIILNYSGSYLLTTPEVNGNILFSDRFDNPNESLNNFLLYEGDHLTPVAEMAPWGFDNDNTPWNFSVRDDNSYDYCAAATSRYKEEGAADDWMLLPRLTISNPSIYLSFKAQSYLAGASDKLNVYVWECDEFFGQLDSDIMERLKSEATLLLTTPLLPGRLENQLEGDWEEFTLPLADFEGKNIYIAFANLNDHQSAIFLDDIMVDYRGNYLLSSSVPSSVVGTDPLEVKCSVTFNNYPGYDTLSATCAIETAPGIYETLSSYEVSGLDYEIGDVYEIIFPDKVSLKAGEINHLSITVSLDGETQVLPLTIANPLFEARRCVLVEEGTGEWCGFCPSGFVALEYLQEQYPGQVAEVSIHHDDSYSFESYVSFLGFQAYPSGRVDRLPVLASPLAVDQSSGLLTLTSASGAETFADLVEQRLALPPSAAFNLTSYNIDSATRRLDAYMEVIPTLNLDDADWNLFSVMTEYDLPARQENNYSGYTDPLMAEWAALSNRVSCRIPAVARALGSPSFYGETGLLPSRLDAGVSYPLELHLTIPEEIDLEKFRLVVALVSNNDGTIINAATAGYGADPSSIRDLTLPDDLNPAQDEELHIYDLQGRELKKENIDRRVNPFVIIRRGNTSKSVFGFK